MDDLVPPPELIEELGIGQGNFKEIGDRFVQRFVQNGWVKPGDTVVDIGCGLGRMARPLTSVLSSNGRFVGFDINRRSIEWCQKRYAGFPNFSFQHVDTKSVFYNPAGALSAEGIKFPMRSGAVDFINMSSVFTHILPDDVSAHLKEVGRLLRPGGRCSITFFLADDPVKRICEGGEAPKNSGLLNEKGLHALPGGYVRSKEKPEAVVILDEALVRQGYKEAGLSITAETLGFWCGDARGAGDSKEQRRFQDCLDAVKL